MNARVQPAAGEVTGFFTAYGVGLEVRAPNAGAIQQVACALTWAIPTASPACAGEVCRYAIAEDASGKYALYAGDEALASSSRLDVVIDRMESAARLEVADRNRERVFVHAGVVGWKGRAIVLPGRSFAGKSSLVAELVRQGATYYSDEYAVCAPDGYVHSFAKDLDLRAEGDTLQTRVDVGAIGGRYGFEPLRVGLVLITRFRRGRRFEPRAVSVGQGMLELLDNTVSARRAPGAALETLERVVAAAAILKGQRGEANEAARRVLEHYASW